MAPKAKAKAAAATEDDDPEVSRAAHLSANLKKSHKARTDALFKRSDVVSEHVKDEAERAALDPNMILMIYLAFLAHLLNPCARPRRQCTLAVVARGPWRAVACGGKGGGGGGDLARHNRGRVAPSRHERCKRIRVAYVCLHGM